MKLNLRRLCISLLASLLVLSGCSATSSSSSTTNEEHPTLTMTTRTTSTYSAFIEALKEAYPEINIELISYAGKNTTEYSNAQLKANDISDIFVMSYPPAEELQKDNLLDLSGEDFISNINMKSLSDVSIDGAVYVVPTNMTIFGIYYNKTLFEEHGWTAPTSLEELEALIPEIEAAGVKLSECLTQYMGATFAYFFYSNVAEYFSSLEGLEWMDEYLEGTASAKGSLEECVETFKHYMDLGLLNVGETPTSDSETLARFREGNTAFLFSNSAQRFTENEDGTGDEYGYIPYLSEDGSNNIVVTNVNFYVGLSKNVQDDPQKLEDALKVMEFITTSEGQASLNTAINTVSPLKDGTMIDESNPLYDAAKLVDEGKSFPLIYAGWESYVADIGEQVYALMNGEITGDELLEFFDDKQQEVLATGESPAIATVEEDLEKEDVAKLVGSAFASATGADCALISIGDFHGGTFQNNLGINGKIYSSVTLNTDLISTFNPLPATRVIKLMTLTGKEIKQFVEEGYFASKNDTTPYTYILVTKNGVELDDDTTYTVACAGESEERSEQGGIYDSEVVSQTAIEDYITSIGTLNKESILWK